MSRLLSVGFRVELPMMATSKIGQRETFPIKLLHSSHNSIIFLVDSICVLFNGSFKRCTKSSSSRNWGPFSFLRSGGNGVGSSVSGRCMSLRLNLYPSPGFAIRLHLLHGGRCQLIDFEHLSTSPMCS
jgi:hypothetical protein